MDEIIGFYQWETADLTVEVEPAEAMEGWTKIAATISQFSAKVNRVFEAGAPEVSGNVINLHLTQEETGQFQPTVIQGATPCEYASQTPKARLQVNIMYGDERDASTEADLDVYENLLDEVL